MLTDVSAERFSSIFRVKEYVKEETSVKQVASRAELLYVT
jgi:hypothetical protein